MAAIPKTIKVDVQLSNVVRPGDKLVVAINQRLDMATADRVKTLISERLPGVEIVVLEAAALAVYPGTEEGKS